MEALEHLKGNLWMSNVWSHQVPFSIFTAACLKQGCELAHVHAGFVFGVSAHQSTATLRGWLGMHGSGDLNSVLHDCTANSLTHSIEPSP